ncbi:hypothetical protein [Pediococcus pentosaceus]|uniref:hypothetical protein n=1 Tax=Pediococcus pentosaceus TaxID=1255 RepID=UPI0011B69CB9|nr:hypothetical protein [Pediococcus pentosaceus]QDZ69490.1 hypothetical protein PSL001_00575 [Pediococcus pentosaceus]
MSLQQLVEKNQRYVLKQHDKLNVINDLNFDFLTNNSNLYVLHDLMENPQDTNLKIKFLTMLETFDKQAMRQKFIFPKKYADIFSDFISSFKNELYSIYTYQILLKKGEEHYNSPMNADGHITIQQCYENIGELDHRKSLNANIAKLKKAYSNLENLSPDDIENQIRMFNPLKTIQFYFFKILKWTKNRPSKIINKIKKLSSRK